MGRPKLLSTLKVRRFVNANRGIIYGMMLGDAYIMARGTGSAMRVLHAEDQKSLVDYQYGLMKEVAPTPPRSFPHAKWGQPKWYFWTACDVEWQKVWSIFHQDCRTEQVNGRKCHYKAVTPRILKEVTDHGFALWIMDDGSYHDGYQHHYPETPFRFFRLHTEGYTYEENELIVSWLKEKYGVHATINSTAKRLKDGTPKAYSLIRIGSQEFEKVTRRVERFVIPELAYKIGPSPLRDNGQLAKSELKIRSGLHGNVQSQPETVGRPLAAGQ